MVYRSHVVVQILCHATKFVACVEVAPCFLTCECWSRSLPSCLQKVRLARFTLTCHTPVNIIKFNHHMIDFRLSLSLFILNHLVTCDIPVAFTFATFFNNNS